VDVEYYISNIKVLGEDVTSLCGWNYIQFHSTINISTQQL